MILHNVKNVSSHCHFSLHIYLCVQMDPFYRDTVILDESYPTNLILSSVRVIISKWGLIHGTRGQDFNTFWWGHNLTHSSGHGTDSPRRVFWRDLPADTYSWIPSSRSWENALMLFQTTQFVSICYRSPKKWGDFNKSVTCSLLSSSSPFAI